MNCTVSLPAFLSRFKCIGMECEDPCCTGWNMQVDTLTRRRYEACGLIDSVTGEGEAAVMKRDPKTGCCVKFEGGLCAIQREFGEQFLGDACYFYPRTTRSLGGTLAMTATLSCPEIARLALFGENPFEETTTQVDRLPEKIRDYLPSGLTSAQAAGIHRAFMGAALRAGATPESNFMRIFAAAECLSQLDPAGWPNAVMSQLAQDNALLPPPEPRPTDAVYLLQALCGLVAAAQCVHRPRLMHTIRDIERALHSTIRWDTLAIASLPDSGHATQALHARWKAEWQVGYAGLLKRYLAMQVSLAFFPFAGFGNTLTERAAIIGIRLATVRLALMSLCQAAQGAPPSDEVVRVVQSISAFLDHLAEPEFSLKIYAETGWLKGARLRGVLEDY
ncbi:MAG TPA: flagellin lysine-N-methylase [Terriglobia bacterium]|nr:flagellin lysine-N-methylase [Terriglobia bacterium]